MKLIKASAFLWWNLIPRCQDVKEEAVLEPSLLLEHDTKQHVSSYYLVAISHRWERSDHPDPHGTQLEEAQRRLQSLFDSKSTNAHPQLDLAQHWSGGEGGLGSRRRRKWTQGPVQLDPSRVGIFYDYCSLYQKPRTEQEEMIFQQDLKDMHHHYAHGAVLILSSHDQSLISDYLERAWCFLEYLVATVTGSLVLQQDQGQLDDKTLRSIQRVLEGTRVWIGGSQQADHVADRHFFIARMLRKVLEGLKVTNQTDKKIIYGIMIRFFRTLNPPIDRSISFRDGCPYLWSLKYIYCYKYPRNGLLQEIPLTTDYWFDESNFYVLDNDNSHHDGAELADERRNSTDAVPLDPRQDMGRSLAMESFDLNFDLGELISSAAQSWVDIATES